MANFEQIEDIELYEMLRQGGENSEKAFTELYRRHSGKVYAYCRRILGNTDDAKDMFQETFVRFYNNARKEKEMANVTGFLIKIARNLCINFKKQNKISVDLNIVLDNYKVPTRGDKDELMGLIRDAIELLPIEYKEPFILREYEGLNYNEISELTGKSMGCIKIRIFRAKTKIREILAPYLEEFSKY